MKSITIKYGVDSITKNVADDTTVSDIKDNQDIQAVLGFGDNVNILNCGVAVDEDSEVVNGATYTVETACNSKAAQQIVIVRFGIERIEKQFETPVTVGMIRQNREIKAALGYGDNVTLLVNGVAQDDSFVLSNGATVVVENRANSKA